MTTVEQEAEATARRVAVLVALYQVGQIERPSFVQAFAQIVYAAKVAAARLTEVALFSLHGWPPLGIAPGPRSLEALQQAAETFTEPQEPEEDLTDLLDRLKPTVTFWQGVEEAAERIAVDAPRASARESAQARMQREGVTHWRWVATPDACDECKERDGQVYPISVRFKDHPRCKCDLEQAMTPASEQPLGFAFLTLPQLRHQLSVLEPLKDTDWKTKQTARVRARIAELKETP